MMDNEVTETAAAQIELDKTAEEFRRAHKDRQELIRQWEITIDQMQRRDREMDMLAMQLAEMKMEVREHEEMIEDKQKFLDRQIDDNKELDKKISMTERSAAKIRLEFKEAEQQRDQFQSELESLKRNVDRTAIDLENTRSQVTQAKKDIISKQEKLEAVRREKEQLTDKLKVVSESELSAEERAAYMDELMSQEERSQERVTHELKMLTEQAFKKSQELHDALTQEKFTEVAITGARAALKNLYSRTNKLDHDALKQMEIIYNQDFNIAQLERRISRMAGDTSSDESIALEKRIEELQAQLDKDIDRKKLLAQQLKHLQDDVRRVKRDLEKCSGEKDDMTTKIEELELHNDVGKNELHKTVRRKEDLMVDENIMKLEVKRLRDILYSKSDEVMSLEKRKLQLQTAMKERHGEIDIHKDMLRAQLRAIEDERQTISTELHDRISKVDKLRKRYEIQMISMAPPEGEEEKSQAYYVIKAAQEKEEWQREGDELDGKIRKAEKEIRALENTLRLMNNRNETYRRSFNKVTDTSEEMEDKRQTQEQHRAVMDKYKYKRRQMRELQEDLSTMSTTLDNLTGDEDTLVNMLEEKQNKILQLSKELDEQDSKLDRVERMNARYAREQRAALKLKGETPDEKDFSIREMRDFNKSVVHQLGEFVHMNPDIAQVVKLFFSQANLPPPATPNALSATSSRVSSLQSSARSSVSSTGSGTQRVPLSGRSPVAAVNIGFGDEVASPASSRSSSSRVSKASSRSSQRF